MKEKRVKNGKPSHDDHKTQGQAGAEMTMLPCPFCGGNAALCNVVGEHFVMCQTCKIMGASTYEDDRAIAAWNTRPQLDSRAARVVLPQKYRAGWRITGAVQTIPDGWYYECGAMKAALERADVAWGDVQQ